MVKLRCGSRDSDSCTNVDKSIKKLKTYQLSTTFQRTKIPAKSETLCTVLWSRAYTRVLQYSTVASPSVFRTQTGRGHAPLGPWVPNQRAASVPLRGRTLRLASSPPTYSPPLLSFIAPRRSISHRLVPTPHIVPENGDTCTGELASLFFFTCAEWGGNARFSLQLI